MGEPFAATGRATSCVAFETTAGAHTQSNCWLWQEQRLDLTAFAKSDASICQSKHWSFGRNI
jgi:hypothetical protein